VAQIGFAPLAESFSAGVQLIDHPAKRLCQFSQRSRPLVKKLTKFRLVKVHLTHPIISKKSVWRQKSFANHQKTEMRPWGFNQ
jgi:hypothetical protein